MSIEDRFDVPLVAGLALREKQIQQSYRPVIGVHKWFARRPGTLFRALVLAEFGEGALDETFFGSNDLAGIRIVDPFMGGGTPLIEANRVGCDVEGFDVNPMAAWIVREEMEAIDLAAYDSAAQRLLEALAVDLGCYYRTRCPLYGEDDVPVKSFLWIKVIECEACGARVDLFPGYLVARDVRHPKNVLLCGGCGALNEVEDAKAPGDCKSCGRRLKLEGPARRGRCACHACGHVNAFPDSDGGPLDHRLFAVEYHNPARKAGHRGRFFKAPDEDDLARAHEAALAYAALTPRFVPDDAIAAGDETRRLLRWGYRRYRELFNPRQLLGLELSCRRIAKMEDERLRRAFATNLSDLLRYQNMLCRYDTMALKALDIFSVHGFPVGLVQCESNLLGIANGSGTSVGSGGWTNIVQKYRRAKAYCERPFEVRGVGSQRERVVTAGERIGNGPGNSRRVAIRCMSATEVGLAPSSVDAMLTDPPYFGNVQYAELMDFCYVWLRRLAGEDAEGFGRSSTRSPHELTGNQTAARGINEFTEGLSDIYGRMARALKPGAPLAFTYHHNTVEAYSAVGVAILDAGLGCSATLPCPAEMGGSIHIHGTSSSIVDTVFVCREAEHPGGQMAFEGADGLVAAVREDAAALVVAGRKPTSGDLRCVLLGHMTRMAVRDLREGWDAADPTSAKLALVQERIERLGDAELLVEVVRAQDETVGEPRAKGPGAHGAEGQLALPF